MIKQAAIRSKDGALYTLERPHRHPDILLKFESYPGIFMGVQGFLTADDIFVDREEAYKIAKDNGQIILRDDVSPTPGVLYTEDLW